VKNIDEILELVDGIMVARGDLAIEVPAEKVPMIQKEIIEKCNNLGKPVITATQMLESMIKAPVPTRAEVSDIANAILDGTDAIMLSEETAMGEFPVEAVSTMTRVAREVEKDYPARYAINSENMGLMDYVDSISGMAVNTAHDIGAKAIFSLTETGAMARRISRFKPSVPVIALTANAPVQTKLMLTWGVTPILIPRVHTLEDLLKAVRTYATKNKLAAKGDKVVVSAGAPFSKIQKANFLMVVEI
jgi:pyruvate kinase